MKLTYLRENSIKFFNNITKHGFWKKNKYIKVSKKLKKKIYSINGYE